MPGMRAAAPNSSGTTFAAPSPTSAKPTADSTKCVLATASASPANIARPPMTMMRSAPKRTISRSPAKRHAAIAIENAEKPSAADAGVAPVRSCISNALQSTSAPSTAKHNSASRPRPSAAPRGSEK